MATGLQADTGRGVFRIVLWDNATLDSEADVETTYELNEKERTWLAHADNMALIVELGTETGSATFDVIGVSSSRDDSKYRTWEDLTDTSLSAAGHYRIDLSKSLLYGKYIRVDADTVTLSGSAYFANSTIAIEGTCKQVYGLI